MNKYVDNTSKSTLARQKEMVPWKLTKDSVRRYSHIAILFNTLDPSVQMAVTRLLAAQGACKVGANIDSSERANHNAGRGSIVVKLCQCLDAILNLAVLDLPAVVFTGRIIAILGVSGISKVNQEVCSSLPCHRCLSLGQQRALFSLLII